MDRVVFVSWVTLTETILRLFPLDALASEGFPVEYWDLSALYGSALPSREVPRPYTRRFHAWTELEAKLLSPSAVGRMIVAAVPYEPRFFRLYRLLSRSPSRLGSVVSGVLPMPSGSPLRRVRESARFLLDPPKVGHFLLKRGALAARRLGAIRPFDVVFAAGAAAREEAGRAPVVPVNSGDYDDWLEHKDSDPRPIGGRYAVYLDQFAAGHPDFALLGIKRLIDPGLYHRLLDSFFARLEKAHGVEVVVAAHPKADYAHNPFGGRKILHASTRALVRHCEFAVATLSTSLGFAVLDRKPLAFFTTEDMMERYRPARHDVAPFLFARALGRTCRVLDRDQDAAVLPADAALYDDYKYRYLVSRETEGRLSRDVYRDYLVSEGLAPASGRKP